MAVGTSLENVETLKVQRLKLQHALERLIDSFTEGLIEKDKFTSRGEFSRISGSKIPNRFVFSGKVRGAKIRLLLDNRTRVSRYRAECSCWRRVKLSKRSSL